MGCLDFTVKVLNTPVFVQRMEEGVAMQQETVGSWEFFILYINIYLNI